ncbi:acyl-CoA dehydrogenase [Kroppenstedtia pulmonis]|uniref:short-chain 2-methylacyl-CoA dehydrogenase n=2 Tax=Kroppenstedtia pulmonis TaxID=1380685 RepID=A0A7D4BS01_9BACL|nr:acyl-CoA dehydrogenase [Kroppenstedtia pulmonis]
MIEAMPLTRLSEEEQLWKEKVRTFSEEKIRPLVSKMDQEAKIAPELLEELFSAGLMGIEIPKVYGGMSGNIFHSILAIEEISRVDPGVAVYVDVQSALIVNAIMNWGNGDQKRRYLPRLAKTTVGAYALSEKNAGSDAFALSTIAEKEGKDFVLNGSKHFTSSAAEAGLFLVFAKTVHEGKSGITAFLVERSSPGVRVGDKVDKMGIRANSTCELVLENVRVRREDILGKPGDGERLAIDTLNVGRIGIAAQMVGLAQGALEAALAYAQKRKQFGQRIAVYQGVQFPLARMATKVEAARLLVYNATRLMIHGATPLESYRTPAMAKVFASEVAEQVSSQAVEIFGGNGFIKEYPVEKFYRDAKIGQIYEGTSNIQFRTIASTLLKGTQGGDLSVNDGSLQMNP